MSHFEVPPFIRRLLGVTLAAVAVVALSSCSFLLDFDECEADGDCGIGAMCTDGICKSPERVKVTDYIVKDTTWTSDKIYVLEDLIFVIQPATLTIEPGTLILGADNGALVTQAGAKLVAEGTRDKPIVFTSAKPEGRRRSGDWGGLALIGKATLNRPNMTLRILENEDVDKVGGSDDTWDCGTLKYVRTEFGGGKVNGQKALNGLTLAACGSQTTVDYVQSHLGDDDGIEVFGGTVDLRHALVTRPQGDGFDIDVGWRGTGQFMAVQMDANGEEGIEIENRGEEPTATPQTDFQIYNYTVIGSDTPTDMQRGMIVKSGGMGFLSHGIILDSPTASLHIEGAEAGQHGAAGDINIENTIFAGAGEAGDTYFTMDDAAMQSGFDPQTYFATPDYHNVFGKDPGMPAPHDLTHPNFKPSVDATTGTDVGAPPEAGGFDVTAVYRGAFAPNADPWTEDWTAYPQN